MAIEPKEWSADVPIGDPSYLKAACRLLWRYCHEHPGVPPNVALAAGYVTAGAFESAKGDTLGARKRWLVEWQNDNGRHDAAVFENPEDARAYAQACKMKVSVYLVREVQDRP